MTTKLKEQMENLVLSLKNQGKLAATDFFKEARQTKWGRLSPSLVGDYNETLGRMMARGQLSVDEVKRAMQP